MDKIFEWIMENWGSIVAFVDKFFAAIVELTK